MSDSTKAARPTHKKPSKPYSDFPLFPHATKRWAKKIRGKTCYFGPWDDPDGALQKYLDQKDDLHAGRTPRVVGDGLDVAGLCNRFLTAKKQLIDTNELTLGTWANYYSTCEKIVREFGKNRLVDDLAIDDFAKLRVSLSTGRAGTLSPTTIGKEVSITKVVFGFAYSTGLIDRPVRFGPSFRPPAKRHIRKARQANGKRMFGADELQTILDSASQPLRTMVLLAINGGLGNTDLSNMPQSVVDFDGGWLDYPRPKTAVERRIPLWPETVEALQEAISVRPDAKDRTDGGQCFLTPEGRRWTRNTSSTAFAWSDGIGKKFAGLLNRLNLKRPGLNFYAIRHTFETVAGKSKDQVAVNSIMGHVDRSMAGECREEIDDQRLRDVIHVVHKWLFAAE